MKKAFLVLLIIFALIGAFFGFTKKNSVVKTIPSPQGLHDPYLPIIIYFTHEPNINQFRFSITPETVFSINTGPNKSIILTPEKGLTPSTDYKLSINTNPLFELVFKTDQLGSNYPGWNDAFEAAALTNEKKRHSSIRGVICYSQTNTNKRKWVCGGLFLQNQRLQRYIELSIWSKQNKIPRMDQTKGGFRCY